MSPRRFNSSNTVIVLLLFLFSLGHKKTSIRQSPYRGRYQTWYHLCLPLPHEKGPHRVQIYPNAVTGVPDAKPTSPFQPVAQGCIHAAPFLPFSPNQGLSLQNRYGLLVPIKADEHIIEKLEAFVNTPRHFLRVEAFLPHSARITLKHPHRS